MKKTRVLVVEDSLTVRQYLCDVLRTDPSLEVIADVSDGKEAIELCQRLRPDVISMDMILPLISGLGATEYIMAHCPTPILIVSASINRGELFKTYEALAAGAVDVLEKSLAEMNPEWERRFIAAVKLVARIKVVTHPRGRLGALGQVRPTPPGSAIHVSPARSQHRHEIIVIGASTGGPGAILAVLRALPSPMPLPVVFVLHIGEPFGASFAEWLDGQTGTRVAYARDMAPIAASIGQITMAPPDHHLTVQGGRFHLSHAAPRHSCRPSIDVLFESVAAEYGARAIACLLTGMGRDGAAGLLEIRRSGGFTIAQDEQTSIVYGMPREAMALGAAERKLALNEIGPVIATLLAQSEPLS